MEENKISCTEAAALMEKYLDGELDARGEAALESHITSCEACFSEFDKLKKTTELLKESALEPPAELYGAVMAKINAEKKKKNLFIRRVGTVCAAALVFVVASVYMMPKFLGGNNMYSPDGISFHNVKSSESDMSVYDGTDEGGMIACSLLSELKVRNGEHFKLGEYKNGAELKLAKVQMGTLIVVDMDEGFAAFDIRTGERVRLCDLIGGESTDTNFGFNESGIKLNGCIVLAWECVTDEAKEKYELTSAPMIMDYYKDAGYKILAVEETQ